jgi:hypothetical protein
MNEKVWYSRYNSFCKMQPRMSLSIIAIEFTNTIKENYQTHASIGPEGFTENSHYCQK